MATILRLDQPHAGDGRRWTAGVLVSSDGTEVSTALVGASGSGLDARCTVAGVKSTSVPPETAALFSPTASAGSYSAAALATLRAQLAEVQAALLSDLLADLGIVPNQILAVGVHDPGLWQFDGTGPIGYLGLCDAARLAEATGLNIIDAFPARDVAQRGQGGPIAAVAQWLLLRDPTQNRVLLDLGRTVRMTYLPAAARQNAVSRLVSCEVGPGTRLLDLLAERLSGGQYTFDPGGRLAVQGRRIPELVARWLRDPYFDRPLPRWHPRGVQPERFLADALQMAVEQHWSIRDLLCSATHLIAEAVALAIRKRLPEDVTIDALVLTGGGQQNGMLLREIARLTDLSLLRPADLSFPDEAIAPAAVAVLALLYLDQVPATHTAITGVEVPRVLGRLTTGSPQNWQRLLQTVAGSSTTIRPLRAAL